MLASVKERAQWRNQWLVLPNAYFKLASRESSSLPLPVIVGLDSIALHCEPAPIVNDARWPRLQTEPIRSFSGGRHGLEMGATIRHTIRTQFAN